MRSIKFSTSTPLIDFFIDFFLKRYLAKKEARGFLLKPVNKKYRKEVGVCLIISGIIFLLGPTMLVEALRDHYNVYDLVITAFGLPMAVIGSMFYQKNK